MKRDNFNTLCLFYICVDKLCVVVYVTRTSCIWLSSLTICSVICSSLSIPYYLVKGLGFSRNKRNACVLLFLHFCPRGCT